MAKEFRPVDISDLPELLRLAEEVRGTNEPRLLQKDGDDIAVLVPVGAAPKRRSKRTRTKAAYEAFLSSAGGWKDLVDTDKLKQDISESRRISSRTPVEL